VITFPLSQVYVDRYVLQESGFGKRNARFLEISTNLEYETVGASLQRLIV